MLKFLGSGGAFNIKRGNNSAYMEFAGELFLFDAGEDVFQKLVKLNLFEKKARVNIFITHLHSDHVGSLGTIIAYLYYKVYNQDMSNICVYFPSEAIAEYLELEGVPRTHYNLFVNQWDDLFIPGFRKKPEYSFYETTHTESLNYKGKNNTYSVELIIPNEVSIFYSGDTNVFHEKLSNMYNYDYVYQEVTMNEEVSVHFSYKKLLEATKDMPADQKAKIYLMHLDEDFDEEMAKRDGFRVAENVEI